MISLIDGRRAVTRDELLYLRSVRAFVTVMNYRVGYSGEVTHVTSSPTTFRPKTQQSINTIKTRIILHVKRSKGLFGLLFIYTNDNKIKSCYMLTELLMVS